MARVIALKSLFLAARAHLRANRSEYDPVIQRAEFWDYTKRPANALAAKLPTLLIRSEASPFERSDDNALIQDYRFGVHHYWQLSDTESTDETMFDLAEITIGLFTTDSDFESPSWWTPPTGVEVEYIHASEFIPMDDHESDGIGHCIVPVLARVHSAAPDDDD